MSTIIPVQRNSDDEVPVPSEWRRALQQVVETIKDGDFAFSNIDIPVLPLSPGAAARISSTLRQYPCSLDSLPNRSWETSVCSWQDGYWDVIVDLFDNEEGLCDLVLQVRVHEFPGYRFEIIGMFVP
ncbi:hypothetical protein [Maricaulis sp.]|uniref:DUF7668 domain-containing protein n=1 Tax=Maricaulis sp. TaxID=1486257 RepID=UPI003A8DFBDA